ncbi:9372_t:CDS:2, partial [Racocetra fulgida]
QTVSRQYHKILDKIDEIKHNQHSGWTYEYSKKIFLEISVYQPLRGRSHFVLPKIWAKLQLGIINPQNTDERCFEACLKGYLANFIGIDFPATLHDIDKFEENNLSYSINVFYPAPSKSEKEQATRKLDPLRISEYNYQREHMVYLILFTEGEEDLRDHHNINEIPPGLNTYYCLINGE